MYLLGSFFQVLEGCAVVLGQLMAIEVHEAQAKLGAATVAVCSTPEPLQGGAVAGGHP